MIPARPAQHSHAGAEQFEAQEAFVPDAVGRPIVNQALNVRLTHAAFAGGLVIVFFLSWWLKPDPRGLGTHEQLMLFPCNFHAVTGIPCPFCGMTTAFAHMARGQVSEALLAQPVGAAGFVACVALLPIAIAGLLAGKDALGAVRRLPWGRLSKALVAMLAASWAFKIAVTFIR
jgi:hypothetical protein